ncbi:hypothetical protein CsSME_00005968 [Camellia sinensis var. sinensis]
MHMLLVWRGDSKSRNAYFDDIIHIIKEESIYNNKVMQEYPPHKRNKLIDIHINDYQGQRYFIFPIHHDFHWTIVVYDFKDNLWRHYNSLRPRPDIHNLYIDKAQIVKDYIEAVVRNIGPLSQLWTKLSGQNPSQPIISVDVCPQQAFKLVD